MATVEKNIQNKLNGGVNSALPLNSLQILRYRCFDHLTIGKVGRVNLIVGKNNVGKTAILEALSIYANSGSERLLYRILEERNEIPPAENGNYNHVASVKGIRNLFFDRPDLEFIPGEYPAELDDGLSFIIGENIDISGKEPKDVNKMLQMQAVRSPGANTVPQLNLKQALRRGIDNLFIKAGGLSDIELVEFWDNIEKWVLDDLVIKALNIVVPNLLDIRFSGYPNGSNLRIPVVRLAKAKERVPLRSLGEGMTRLLGIASALINCRNGMLLVDEIESGLHYSVLPDVWKLIFQTAKDLDIQVFATTHSFDCIEAFARAAIDDTQSDGLLIRLARNEDQIKAFTFDETQLDTITKEGIEVR